MTDGRYETPFKLKWLKKRIHVLFAKKSIGVLDPCPNPGVHEGDGLITPYLVDQMPGESGWPWLDCHYHCETHDESWSKGFASWGVPWEMFVYVEPPARPKGERAEAPAAPAERAQRGAVYAPDCALGCKWHPSWL